MKPTTVSAAKQIVLKAKEKDKRRLDFGQFKEGFFKNAKINALVKHQYIELQSN